VLLDEPDELVCVRVCSGPAENFLPEVVVKASGKEVLLDRREGEQCVRSGGICMHVLAPVSHFCRSGVSRQGGWFQGCYRLQWRHLLLELAWGAWVLHESAVLGTRGGWVPAEVGHGPALLLSGLLALLGALAVLFVLVLLSLPFCLLFPGAVAGCEVLLVLLLLPAPFRFLFPFNSGLHGCSLVQEFVSGFLSFEVVELSL